MMPIAASRVILATVPRVLISMSNDDGNRSSGSVTQQGTVESDDESNSHEKIIRKRRFASYNYN